MKKHIFIGFAFIGLLTAVGCKPTERNYKAAYDAAVAKRQTVDVDLDIAEDDLIQEGQPSPRTLMGQQVLYLASPLSPVSEGGAVPEKYNVVCGAFKMPVNALDQSRNLRHEGLDAFAARGEQDRYYTVAGTFDNLDDALAFYASFMKKHPDFRFVGIPGLTLLERP